MPIHDPLIRCGFGLGNRVAAMANGLSRHASIRFVWRVNKHLPLDHDQVFPGGLDGVRFVDAPPGFATRFEGITAQSWEAAGCRHRAADAYRRIIAAMAGTARPCDAALIIRWHRTPDADLDALCAAVAAPGRSVFVLTDKRRQEIAARLVAAGSIPLMPESRELAHDMDRDADDMLAFLGDWKTALAAPVLISAGETSLAYPANLPFDIRRPSLTPTARR